MPLENENHGIMKQEFQAQKPITLLMNDESLVYISLPWTILGMYFVSFKNPRRNYFLFCFTPVNFLPIKALDSTLGVRGNVL